MQILKSLIQSGYIVDILSYEGCAGHWWSSAEANPTNGELKLVHYGGVTKRAIRKLVISAASTMFGHSRIDLELIHTLKGMLKARDYSHVVISYAQYAYLLKFVTNHRTNKICDTHDIWTIVEKSRGMIGTSTRSIGRALAWEIDVLNAADITIAISPSEKLFFQSVLSSRVEFLPPWFELDDSAHELSTREFDLVYVGSQNLLNVQGLRWFLKEVFPHFPRLKLLIAGNISELIKGEVSHLPNIKVLGFIANPKEAYSRAKVAICPMFGGAGVKIKIIEALSYGLPVIATDAVAPGLIPGFENACFLASDANRFRNLLSNLDEIVNNNAVQRYAKLYSKDSAAKRVSGIFKPEINLHAPESPATDPNAEQYLQTYKPK